MTGEIEKTRNLGFIRIHYPDSEFCSYSLILHGWRRSSNYISYSLSFDPIWTQTHDLPHWKRAHNHYTNNVVSKYRVLGRSNIIQLIPALAVNIIIVTRGVLIF
jgi:hypothetical protein